MKRFIFFMLMFEHAHPYTPAIHKVSYEATHRTHHPYRGPRPTQSIRPFQPNFNPLLKTVSPSEVQELISNMRVLQMYTNLGFGGARMYKLNLYKLLRENGCSIFMLFGEDKKTASDFESQQLPHYLWDTPANNEDECDRILSLAAAIETVCRKENIQIVHCHLPDEVYAAKIVARTLPIKIVATLHGNKQYLRRRLKNIHGAIGVNAEITTLLQQSDHQRKLGIKNIEWIAPFINEDLFLNYQPGLSRTEFFKNEFGIDIKNEPIITNVSNFYPCKNQKAIIHAAAALVHQKKRPIHVMLAGVGKCMQESQELARKLQVENYVHFLGYTNKIPDLLFHSDIKVMASLEDSFPLAVMEAACMQKPVIGTLGTGMIHMIQHGKSGLLFNPKSPRALVSLIEKYLDNPPFAQECARNIHAHWKNNFSSDACLKKLASVYVNSIAT